MRHEVVSSGRRNRMFDHGLLSLLYPIFLEAHLSHFLFNQLLLSCYLWNLTYERPFETVDEVVLYFSDGCQVISLVVSLSLESL